VLTFTSPGEFLFVFLTRFLDPPAERRVTLVAPHPTVFAMSSTASPTDSECMARTIRRKVAVRLLPLIFLLYVIAYLDRANVSFAKLRMLNDLGLSETAYGWGVGLFFVGYLLLEIPGALLVERWSARKWFARILVTWGLCSMGMALVRTETQFYLMRFLLGLAEAGFFPGVIVYLTHWFPRRERARALAGLTFGVPFSLALGAYVSGLLIERNWFGLAGWQWMFLVEGAPALVLGVAVPFLLPDRPADARWLSPAERRSLEATLATERQAVAGDEPMTLGRALRLRDVWRLAVGIMAINTGGYALVFWLPTAVSGILGEMGRSAEPTDVLLWVGYVYLCGMAAIVIAGQSSDRTGERKWHCVGGLMLAGAGLALSTVPGQPWMLVFAWLCLAGFGAFFWIPPYWVLPTTALTASAAAVAVGAINMCANLAGLFGSPVVGRMKDTGFGDRECLLFLAAFYVLGGGIISTVGIRRTLAAAKSTQPSPPRSG
jgi:MFS transporter, ACS family, tartrate transporter